MKSKIFLLFLGLTLIQFVYIFSYWDEKKRDKESFTNPYLKKDYKYSLKTALHLHSDEVLFSPQRHSIKDILNTYKEFNYDLISISDYNFISTYEDKVNLYLPSYEWGMNFRKRHMLVIGERNTAPSYFILSSFLPNVQYVINDVKTKLTYVVINHPYLYSAFSLEDLLELKNYDAIEIFSPNGDLVSLWDDLLSKNKRVHCMADDDLHFFPEEVTQKLEQNWIKKMIQYILLQRHREGESLKRYILINSDEYDSKQILHQLQTGNFFCGVKFKREFPDMPKPSLFYDGKKIEFHSESEFHLVRAIGMNGSKIKELNKTNEFTFEIPKDYTGYIRFEFVDYSGILYSNPIWIP